MSLPACLAIALQNPGQPEWLIQVISLQSRREGGDIEAQASYRSDHDQKEHRHGGAARYVFSSGFHGTWFDYEVLQSPVRED